MNWLTDWLIDWTTERLTDRLNDWLTDWLTDWPIDGLTNWRIDSLTHWLIDSLTHWMINWLIDWLIDWPMTVLLIDGGFICRLIDWFIDLTDWIMINFHIVGYYFEAWLMFHNITFTLSHMNTSSDEYIQSASRATEEVSQLNLDKCASSIKSEICIFFLCCRIY